MSFENRNEMYGAEYQEGASCPCCWNKEYADNQYDAYEKNDNYGCDYDFDYDKYDCDCDCDRKKPERPDRDCGKKKECCCCCCCCHKNEKPEEKPDCGCDKHEKAERPACCCNCNYCGQCNCCCEKKEEKPCKEEIFLCKKVDCKHDGKKETEEKFDRHTWDDWNTWNPCGCKEKKRCVCRLFKCKF